MARAPTRDRTVEAERVLRTQRFLALMDQLAEEWGGVKPATDQALKGAITDGYVYKVRSRLDGAPGSPWKHAVSVDKLRAICSALGLRMEFFTDPALGDAPDYHEHLEDGAVVEREEDLGPPGMERFFEGMAGRGTPVPGYIKREMRDTARSEGPDSITEAVAALLYQQITSGHARRALERPTIDAGIESDRGQRALPRKTGGRR